MEVLLPIIFFVVNKRSKASSDGANSALNLSIFLWIVRICCPLVLTAKKSCFQKLVLRALVRKKPVGKSTMAEYVLDEKVVGLVGGQPLRTRCKPKHLGELIHGYQNTCICIGL